MIVAKEFHWLVLWALALGLTACSTASPEQTQLQLREMQSRTFDTSEQKLVMKAVLNVLSDRGYTIDNSSLDLGQITGTKRDAMVNSGLAALTGTQFTRVIQCSVNVSQFGTQTRVRAVFQGQLLNKNGGIFRTEDGNDPAEHAELYQKFFADLDKAIFIQQQNI